MPAIYPKMTRAKLKASVRKPPTARAASRYPASKPTPSMSKRPTNAAIGPIAN